MMLIHLLVAISLALFWTGVFFLLASLEIVPIGIVPWIFIISFALSMFFFCLIVASARRNRFP